jgi:hypothetical protein
VAETSATEGPRSSINTFVISPLIMDGLILAYDLDHSTTPEAVRISKASSMAYIQERYGS